MNLKQKLQNLVFPIGSIQKIRMGYLKGNKIRLTENSLWSPIVGNWEPAMQKIMVNIIEKDTIVYDIGANNGLHGLLLSQLVDSSNNIYNFEPLAENIKEIDENFFLNGIKNYKNIVAAVSDKKGKISFTLGSHAKQGHIEQVSNDNNESITVDTISLDDFIEEGNPLPGFIKMDIEGAEGSALEGYTRNIEKSFPNMIIELHSPEQDLKVGSFLSFFGYQAYRFDTFKKLSFEKIKDFKKPAPFKDGIWGSIFCIGRGKDISQFSFTK